MQREIRPHLLSRVSAYDWFGSLLFLSLGYTLAEPASDRLGATTTLNVGAAVMAGLLLVPGVDALAYRTDPDLRCSPHDEAPGARSLVSRVVQRTACAWRRRRISSGL